MDHQISLSEARVEGLRLSLDKYTSTKTRNLEGEVCFCVRMKSDVKMTKTLPGKRHTRPRPLFEEQSEETDRHFFM